MIESLRASCNGIGIVAEVVTPTASELFEIGDGFEEDTGSDFGRRAIEPDANEI